MRIGFYLTVYRDEIWAYRMVKQINQLYPDAPVLVTTDGPANLSAFEELNVTLLPYEIRLKVFGNGGHYSQRNMIAALNMAESYKLHIVFKVDPDSYLWRIFNYYPDAQWFGNVYTRTFSKLGELTFCAGGCFGMRTPVLKSLVDSELLLDEKLYTEEIAYPRYSSKVYAKPGDTERSRELILNDDLAIGWAMTQVGVVPEVWNEVELKQNGELIQQLPYRYAVTHPVRTLP